MTFTLGDDGTMDTVLTCDECRETERYTFDGCDEHMETPEKGGCKCYEEFVNWALEDVNTWHQCRF
jgi:hypothetical protein